MPRSIELGASPCESKNRTHAWTSNPWRNARAYGRVYGAHTRTKNGERNSQSHSSMSKYTLAPENVAPADRVCTARNRLAQSIRAVLLAFDANSAEVMGWYLRIAVHQTHDVHALVRDSARDRSRDLINLALAFDQTDMVMSGDLVSLQGDLGNGVDEGTFPCVAVLHKEGLHHIRVKGHSGLVLAKRGQVHVLTGKFERTPLLLPAGVGGLL